VGLAEESIAILPTFKFFDVIASASIWLAEIVPVVILPPSILVIVEPSKAKSPPVKVTNPENSTAFVAVEPVAAVVEKGAEVSTNNNSELQTELTELATIVGGVKDHPEVTPLKAPVDQVIVAEGV